MPKNPQDPLTAVRIYQAALALIGQKGIEALSMRALAAALHVDPMAIYHHIPNKAALIHGVYNAVMGELLVSPDPQASWQSQLQRLAHHYRALALRHHRLFPGLIASGETTENESKALGLLLSALQQAGLSPRATVQAGDSVFAFVTGFALIETRHVQHPKLMMSLGEDKGLAPAVVEEVMHAPFSESFDFGLRLVIAGIEADAAKNSVQGFTPTGSGQAEHP